MIRIRPELDFVPRCPRDHTPMPGGKVMVVGSRSLLDVTCPVCNSAYLADLPVSFALHSPGILDQRTNEVFGDGISTWFHDRLKDAWVQRQDTSPIGPVKHVFKRFDRIVLLNCLDSFYGHVLLKLLNAQRYMRDPDLGVCVLVPTQMVHLVPTGVSEIWEIKEPLKEGWRWHPGLAEWIDGQFVGRTEVYFSKASCHPRDVEYDLDYLSKLADRPLTALNDAEPVVLFNYREDRPWGPTLLDQGSNIQQLYDILYSVFPKLAFVMLGFGKSFNLRPGSGRIVDARVEKFNLETDLDWLALMKRSDCAIGVHGSNMLLPSGLSKSCLILVSSDRYCNSVEDMLFDTRRRDARIAQLTHRMIYGNHDMTDISPRRVAELVCTQISYSPVNEFLFNQDLYENAEAMLTAIAKSDLYRQTTKFFQPGPARKKTLAQRATSRIARELHRVFPTE